MIVAIPGHKAADALVDGRVGFETNVALKIADIGVCSWHVAGLEGEEVLLGLAAEGLLDGCDEVHQLHGAVIADIVEPVRRQR